MTTKPPAKVYLILFGLGGHGLEMENARLSGYENPETFVQRVAAGDYKDYALVGATVIDKREVLKASPFYALASPLVDVTLTDGHVERFADIAKGSMVADYVKRSPGNAYGTFVRAAEVATAHGIAPGPLDQVSPRTYVSWWRSRGARIGTVCQCEGHVFILWNDAARDPIPDQLLLPGADQACPFPLPQCRSTSGDDRCVLQVGHDAPHTDGEREWDGDVTVDVDAAGDR